MKNIYYLLIFLLSSFSAIHAQTIQKGNVVLQNSGNKSLGGVQITAFGAQPTDTDNNGEFKLHFSKTSVGELAPIRQAYKKGYELVNKHETEQWILSDSKALRVVMCPSGSLQAAREKYYGIGSSLYIKRYEHTYAAIEKQKEVNALNDTAYANRLEEAYNELTQSQERLAEYADQFARVNLDDLSELEHQAHALLEEGKLDEAIQIYENQKLLEKLKQQATIKEQAGENMEAMIPSLKRYADMCIFGGGKENMDKAKEILKAVAESEFATLADLFSYGVFLHKQTDYTESIIHLNQALNRASKPVEVARSYSLLGEVYTKQNDFTNAIESFTKGDNIYKSLAKEEMEMCRQDRAELLTNLAEVYYYLNDFSKTYTLTIEAEQVNESPIITDPLKYKECQLNIWGMQGVTLLTQMYMNENVDKEVTLEKLKRAEDELNKLLLVDATQYQEYISSVYTNLANYYALVQEFDLAAQTIQKSIEHNEKVYKHNPDMGMEGLSIAYNTIGNFHLSDKQYDDAQKYMEMSFDLRKALYEKNPKASILLLANAYNSLGTLYGDQKEYTRSVNLLQEGISLLNEWQSYREMILPNLTLLHVNLASVYISLREYAKAEETLNKTLELIEEHPIDLSKYQQMVDLLLATVYIHVDYNKFLKLKPAFREHLGNSNAQEAYYWNEQGQRADEQERKNDAEIYYKESVQLYELAINEVPSEISNEVAVIEQCYQMGDFFHNSKQNDLAIRSFKILNAFVDTPSQIEQSVSLLDTYANAFLNKAYIHIDNNHWGDANICLKKSLEYFNYLQKHDKERYRIAIKQVQELADDIVSLTN